MKALTQIKDRFTGESLFEVDVEGESEALRLGSAVKVALKSRASLVGAVLDRANLYGASLVGAVLDRASLVGAVLDRANLYGASLDRANLYGASLVGASLDGASLYRASLVGAVLDRASLVGAVLDRANLYGASLVGASLVGASGIVKRMGVEPGNFYWKRFEAGLNNNGFQFKVGVNILLDGEVFDSDDRITCSYPGFHFASRSWCAVNYQKRPLEARIRIPEDAQINEPIATDGKASADRIEIIQVFEVATGKDVTSDYISE